MSMVALLLLGACEAHGLVGSNVSAGFDPDEDDGVEPVVSTGVAESTSTTSPAVDDDGDSTTGEIESGGGTTELFIWDVGTDEPPEVCVVPQSTTCDYFSEDPWHALGVNCPGSEAPPMDVTFLGHPAAMTVHEGVLGTHGTFAPREGERMLILSTGRANDVARTHEDLGCDPLTCPSTALAPGVVLDPLPAPIDVSRVGTQTCAENPALVGTGDCSNTLEEEWKAGNGALDYAEVRITAKVPPFADGFAYQFAFFSAEYPLWAGGASPWNDMYVAWLESEEWTGNISFDEYGHPISIGGVFLDYLDAPSPLCESDCVAPELDGFAMDGHAGTRWLETIAPVRPGEEIEVVFALFDMSDASYDTVVLLDNVHWGCTDLPPVTNPEG